MALQAVLFLGVPTSYKDAWRRKFSLRSCNVLHVRKRQLYCGLSRFVPVADHAGFEFVFHGLKAKQFCRSKCWGNFLQKLQPR